MYQSGYRGRGACSCLFSFGTHLCFGIKKRSVAVLVVWFTTVLSVVMNKGLTCWATVFVLFFSLEALLVFFVLFLATISIKSDIGVGNTLSAVKGSKETVLTLSCVLLD